MPGAKRIAQVVVLSLPAAAWAQPCSPAWTTDFSTGGPDAPVSVMAVYDDGRGGGPTVYIAGGFSSVGRAPARGVARWNGSAWEALPPGGPTGVTAMVAFTASVAQTPGLYAASGAGLYRFDGAGWHTLPGAFEDQIWALAVHDDGSGPALYAGGQIFETQTSAAQGIVRRWTGNGWATVTGAFEGSLASVNALASATIEETRSLYAGGGFAKVDGIPASLARWTGEAWEPISSNLRAWLGDTPAIRGLYALDDGAGPALFATGNFIEIGGVASLYAARFDGVSWQDRGSSFFRRVPTLAVLPTQTGPRMYAGGAYSVEPTTGGNAGIAVWDGQHWSAASGVMGGSSPAVNAIAICDSGGGPQLFAAGSFSRLGDRPAENVARFDGQQWSGLAPTSGLSDSPAALAVYDDGSGPALYAGGQFRLAGGGLVRGLARWDGHAWAPLGGGVAGDVRSLVVFDDGSGRALFVGGSFLIDGATPIRNLAKWDGHAWSSVGAGSEHPVQRMIGFRDATGPGLYFVCQDDRQVHRWNGRGIAPVGGMFGGPYPVFQSMVVYDDGSGPALYVGGQFNGIGSVDVHAIARWNGQEWSALSGMPLDVTDQVSAMAVMRRGDRDVLYAGRYGNTFPPPVVAWDGRHWNQLASLPAWITALAVFDDGSGPALYAGGQLSITGPGGQSHSIARWTGQNWEPLDAGVGAAGAGAWVSDMAVFDDGSGSALFAAGEFTSASGRSAGRIAKWSVCEGAACYANCDGSTAAPVLNVNDFVCFQSRFLAGDPYANCDGSTQPPVLTVNDLVCFQARFVAGCR